MKTCIKCRQEKTLCSFSKKQQSKDGLQSTCKQCAAGVAKNWYHENKTDADYVKRRNDAHEKVVAELKAEINDYKSSLGCCFCMESDPCCLDFHHLSDKDKDVSYLIKVKNKKRIYEEIKKCVVVCANCHRKIHAGKLNPPVAQLVAASAS